MGGALCRGDSCNCTRGADDSKISCGTRFLLCGKVALPLLNAGEASWSSGVDAIFDGFFFLSGASAGPGIGESAGNESGGAALC